MVASTVTVRPLAGDSVTVNVAEVVPVLPSFTEMLLTESWGRGSSSTIVPVPMASASGAPLALLNVTVNVSSSSSSVSSVVATVIVSDVSFGTNVSVPVRPV